MGTECILFVNFLTVFRKDKPKLKLEHLKMIERSCFVFYGATIESLCCCAVGNANDDNLKFCRTMKIRRSSIRYANYFLMLFVFYVPLNPSWLGPTASAYICFKNCKLQGVAILDI